VAVPLQFPNVEEAKAAREIAVEPKWITSTQKKKKETQKKEIPEVVRTHHSSLLYSSDLAPRLDTFSLLILISILRRFQNVYAV
jgi:hypothetical protein